MTLRAIAWDVDDVLNDFTRRWLRDAWIASHPGCRLRYEDLTRNPPHELLAVTSEEYLDSLDDYRLDGRYRDMPASPEALGWFERHGEKFRHIALTAVPRKAAAVSAEWVVRNFGRWIRTFHFVPSLRPGEDTPRYDASKGEALSWLADVDLFVDDTPAHISSAEKAGVRGLLFPAPWNNAGPRFNWDDVSAAPGDDR